MFPIWRRITTPIVLRVADLPSAEMRKLVAGSVHAKYAAMWEGPFEFLCLD